MKNIYIIDESISSQKNGIGTFLGELIFCLKESEHDLNLITFNADGKEFNITVRNGIKNILFPVFKYGHFLGHSKSIKNLLRLYIPDSPNNIFLLNHSPCSDFIETLKETHPHSLVVFTIHDFGWTSPLMGDLNKYKKIVIKDTDNSTDSNPIFEIYNQEKRMYDLVDRVVCLSKDAYNILQTIYKVPKTKIFLIPNGLRLQSINENHNKDNIERIRVSKQIKNEDKILLFIGRPTKEKGIFDLIKALKLVIKDQQNIKLVIVDDGNEVSMKEIINASSEIAASVIFTGQLKKSDVQKWLSIADIGLIPSYYEQCSYTAIEMMMHGLPIIASDGLGIRNMFKDGDNAKVVKIGNGDNPTKYQKRLAKTIMDLLESPDLCHNLRGEILETYKSHYEIKEMKKNYNKLIESF